MKHIRKFNESSNEELNLIRQLLQALKAVDGYEKRHEPAIGTQIINEVRKAIRTAEKFLGDNK